jgi:hypothetical protein
MWPRWNACPSPGGTLDRLRANDALEHQSWELIGATLREWARYRHWFDGHAAFFGEAEPETLRRAIADVLAQPPEPVADTERAAVLACFDWGRIYGEFWTRVLDA